MAVRSLSMDKPLWQPDEKRKSETNLARFMRWANERLERPLSSYRDLHALSIADPGRFWAIMWEYCAVIGDQGRPPFLVDGDRMPGARFFPEARLNYAENALARGGDGDALVFWGETKIKRRVTWAELNVQVAQVQAMLSKAGVAEGDRVAAIMPNMPESAASLLGVASIGAVWSSCSPDFGVQGVLDRFGQIA